MFRVMRTGDSRLDIEFSGKLNADEMKTALDDLTSKAEGIEHGRMLYRIGEFDLPSVAAMSVELLRVPQLLRFIRRFDRAAVIADKAWVRKASEIEGALVPGLEVKAFEPDQEAEAKAWLDG